MHYNIALLPKKLQITLMCYVSFALLFKYEQGLIVCF